MLNLHKTSFFRKKNWSRRRHLKHVLRVADFGIPCEFLFIVSRSIPDISRSLFDWPQKQWDGIWTNQNTVLCYGFCYGAPQIELVIRMLHLNDYLTFL